MLITFRSDADGDVIMFGDVGKQMLTTLGKDCNDARGIVTVEQLAVAIAAIESAIQADKVLRAAQPEDDGFTDHDPLRPKPEPVVSFAQRAIPLLTMLHHAQRAKVAVVWEAT